MQQYPGFIMKSYKVSSKEDQDFGIAGAIRSPSRSGRRPRIPSTQPTITVEAVPVSQWT